MDFFSTRQSRAAAEELRLVTFTNGLSGSLETALQPGSPTASGPPLSPR